MNLPSQATPESVVACDGVLFLRGLVKDPSLVPTLHSDIPKDIFKVFGPGIRHMTLYWVGTVKKCNRFKNWQPRVLLLAPHCVFLCDTNGDINRCITIPAITKVFKDRKSTLGFTITTEYDLIIRFLAVEARDVFLERLSKLFSLQVGNLSLPCQDVGHIGYADMAAGLNLKKPPDWATPMYPDVALVRGRLPVAGPDRSNRPAPHTPRPTTNLLSPGGVPPRRSASFNVSASKGAEIFGVTSPSAPEGEANPDQNAKDIGGKKWPKCRYCDRRFALGKAVWGHQQECAEQNPERAARIDAALAAAAAVKPTTAPTAATAKSPLRRKKAKDKQEDAVVEAPAPSSRAVGRRHTVANNSVSEASLQRNPSGLSGGGGSFSSPRSISLSDKKLDDDLRPSVSKSTRSSNFEKDDDAEPIRMVASEASSEEEGEDDDAEPIRMVASEASSEEEGEDDDAEPIRMVASEASSEEEGEDDDAEPIRMVASEASSEEEGEDDDAEPIRMVASEASSDSEAA